MSESNDDEKWCCYRRDEAINATYCFKDFESWRWSELVRYCDKVSIRERVQQWIMGKHYFIETEWEFSSFPTSYELVVRISRAHSRRLSRDFTCINWVIKWISFTFFFSSLSVFFFIYEIISQLAANLTAQSCTLSRAYYLKYCSHHHQPHRPGPSSSSEWWYHIATGSLFWLS